jgi:hypothetical protein
LKLINKTIFIGSIILMTACNDNSESTEVKQLKEKSIPSFGKSKAVGCEAIEKNNDEEECHDKSSLTSSERILDKLTKASDKPSDSSPTDLHLAEKDVELNVTKNSSQQLTMLVENSTIKQSVNSKEDLVQLMASVDTSELLEADVKSIGRFDKEQFKNTWEELDALVTSSEDTTKKQELLKIDLENLVIAASSDSDNIEEVTKKVKSLIDTSTKDSSSKNRKFVEHIISDISNKKIELLESNEKWIKIKIKSGDSLSTLAKNYYGDMSKFRVIYNANRDKIKDNYIIYTGDTLKIPTLNSIQGI